MPATSDSRVLKRQRAQSDVHRDPDMNKRHEFLDPRSGGAGYPEWFRERVMQLPYAQAMEWISPSTHHRWSEALRAIGTLHRVPHDEGRPRKISPMEVAVVHLIKVAHPTTSADELINSIGRLFGRVYSRKAMTHVLKDWNEFGTMSYVRTKSDAPQVSGARHSLPRRPAGFFPASD